MISFVWQLLILIIRDLQLESYYYHFCPLSLNQQKVYFTHFWHHAKIQTFIKYCSQTIVQTYLYFRQTESVYCKLYISFDIIAFLFSSKFRSVGKLREYRETTTTRVGLCYWTLSLQIIAQSTRNGKCSQIIGEQSQLYLPTNTNTISIRRLHSQLSVILSMWEQQYYKHNIYICHNSLCVKCQVSTWARNSKRASFLVLESPL